MNQHFCTATVYDVLKDRMYPTRRLERLGNSHRHFAKQLDDIVNATTDRTHVHMTDRIKSYERARALCGGVVAAGITHILRNEKPAEVSFNRNSLDPLFWFLDSEFFALDTMKLFLEPLELLVASNIVCDHQTYHYTIRRKGQRPFGMAHRVVRLYMTDTESNAFTIREQQPVDFQPESVESVSCKHFLLKWN